MVARGEVCWLELEEEGRRPVLVLTRDEALPRLPNVVVALVTRTVRGIETEVAIGPADGMPVECAVSLDNLRTVSCALLTEPITKLDPARMEAVCRALAHSASSSSPTSTTSCPLRTSSPGQTAANRTRPGLQICRATACKIASHSRANPPN